MFDQIKKAFSKDAGPAAESGAASSQPGASGLISGWAESKGLSYAPQGTGGSFVVQGRIGGKPWKLEVGAPSRPYIQNHELRARADLGINEDVAVLVMNRSLREALEKKAYSLYTDSVQTMAGPNLPEEMRWLAIYEEVGWDSAPREFWTRYSVLANRRANASTWVDDTLTHRLLQWPGPAHSAETPVVVMLLRGKAYLRMQYQLGDMPTLRHAVDVFTHACETAVASLSTDISI